MLSQDHELCLPRALEHWASQVRPFEKHVPFCTFDVEIVQPDREVLVGLYKATGGVNWTRQKNWLTENTIDTWEGVRTDRSGRVIQLSLYSNGLTGSIPAELATLSKLEQLYLSGNSLTGPIPTELGQLSNLRMLRLNGNKLTSGVPAELGNLSQLEALDLAENSLSGAIPPELGELSSLVGLNLSRNQVTGKVPPELSNLQDLRMLRLDGNLLTGALPVELGSLELQTFAFTGNQLCVPAVLIEWLWSIWNHDHFAGLICLGSREERNDGVRIPIVNVSDGRAKELPGARMKFWVWLDRGFYGKWWDRRTVTVRYKTQDRTAEERKDYVPATGTLRFRAGESIKHIYVEVLDDVYDESTETFSVQLTPVKGGVIGRGVGVGTIENSDALPAAWLARLGRTVAEQALDGISRRMESSRTPGMQGNLGGQSLSFDPWGTAFSDATLGNASVAGDAVLAIADVSRHFGGGDGLGDDGLNAAGTGRTMTARELMLESNFELTGEKDAAGGSVAFWGRVSQARFRGEERGDGTMVSLDGEVTTGMLGADYARGRRLVGLALAQSKGEGGHSGNGPDEDDSRSMSGKVESSLAAAIPYAALQASERLKLWGALGYGSGEVTLKPDEGESMSADIEWTMAAAGLRGDAVAPPTEGSGPALAVTSDALWARTSSEKTADLAASDSDVTRLRLGLEGSWRIALEGGGVFTPKLETGARHDRGDAETGFGIELGGGIAWVDPRLGLSLDVEGRTLLAHEDGDLKDRGMSAALSFDPDPATEQGPFFRLRREFGSRANGGLDALFAPDPISERSGNQDSSRWTAEAGWGFPALSGCFTASPHVGFGLSERARDYSLGWRLRPDTDNTPNLSLGIKATRRENDTARPEHASSLEMTVRW